jgi:exosortase A
VFLYLVWIRREHVEELKPRPNYWGLPLLGGLAFVWLLGNLGEVRLVQEVAVVAMLVAVIWTLLGTGVVRALAFPLLFLFFAVPFGTSLIRPLQDFTAWFVIHALTASKVPAVLENHTISVPSGVWTVAEACSGIRFLLSSTVLGTVFAFLAYQSRRRRTLFVCASVLVPIIGNGLRAYGTVLLAYITNNKLAAGVDHIVYGVFFFVLLQFTLMAVGLRWRQRPEPVNSRAPRHSAVGISGAKANGSLGKVAFAAVAASALVVATPLLATCLWNRATTATEWADPPVMVSAPWRGMADVDMSWAPEWRNPDGEFSRTYTHDQNRVDLYWVLYSGHHGMDFVTTSDGTARTKSWALLSDGFGNATVGGQNVKVYRSLIESGIVTRAVWTLYHVGREYTANRARVRFLQTKARLLGKSAAVAVINLGADNEIDSADTERVMQDFLLHASFSDHDPIARRFSSRVNQRSPHASVVPDAEYLAELPSR